MNNYLDYLLHDVKKIPRRARMAIRHGSSRRYWWYFANSFRRWRATERRTNVWSSAPAYLDILVEQLLDGGVLKDPAVGELSWLLSAVMIARTNDGS